MSACASMPALGPASRSRHRKLGALRHSERFSLGFVLFALLVVLATRGTVGAEVLSAAITCSFFMLPLEYAAVSLALGPLLPTVVGALPLWYVDEGRWFLIILGTAVVWLRIRSRPRLRKVPLSVFRLLFLVFVAAAGLTVLTSTSPSLSAAKCVLLAAGVIAFSCSSYWLAGVKGGSAPGIWVRAWLLILVPILAANVAARLVGLEGISAGSSFRGLSGNANSLGVTVALALPFLVCQFVYRRRQPPLVMQGYALLVLASLYMLYASWSRASLAAFFAGLAVLFWIHPINRINRFVVLGALLGLAVFAANPRQSIEFFESWIYKGRGQEGLLAARADQWQLGYDSFMERPILGVGYGVTSVQEEWWDLETFRYLKIEQGSSFFALLGQVGLLGTLPIYLAIFLLLVRSLFYARRVRDPWLSGIVASSYVGVVNSFFEGWLASPSSGLFWFVVFQFFFLDAVMSRLKPPPRSMPLMDVSHRRTAPWRPPTPRLPNPPPAVIEI